ncbi:MAG: CRTAC1 family protein [Verrucomicrobia bacterium]|nr:CRTAC1 family protein [Verrucomicrobiota bacterium]
MKDGEGWVEGKPKPVGRLWVFFLAGCGVLSLGGLMGWLAVGRKPASPKPPASSEDSSPAAAPARFRNVTLESGLRFVHFNGATGEKLLPETMGGGVAFFDAEDDGDQDLVFVNGTAWSGSGGPQSSLELYLNDGHGKFREATRGSGLEKRFYGMGVACGDYDGDGLTDLYCTAVGGNFLFRNLGGGKFEETTLKAGVGGDGGWSTGAAWIDFDRDGDLDLFVCNYVKWSRELDMEANYRLPGLGRSYGPPVNFGGAYPWLFLNEGRGEFREVSQQAGLRVRLPGGGGPKAKSLAVAPVDIDRDGWMDLVVANDTVQNFVFLNRQNGTFEEVGARYGIAFDTLGQTRGAMGIDTAKFRNDEALGIAIGNFANEMNALYVSQREMTLFADEAVAEGLGAASRDRLTFGLFFFDYDLDGRLDLLTANGHLDEFIERSSPGQRYRQAAQLFWNQGGVRGERFVPVEGPSDLFQPMVGRGSAYADIDGDGDLDVVMTQVGGPALLVRNESSAAVRWIRLRLKGRGGNTDAIGAWVMARVNGQELARQVMPTKSYLSQSELPITLGLGQSGRLGSLEVRWPNGRIQKVEGIEVNRSTLIQEP